MATATFLPETVQLQERVAAGVGRVDREAGVIRGVRVLGRVSKNGRTYLPQAITGAKPFYEGIRVNCDHPASARGDRSIADRIGWLAGVRESDGGLRGDLHLILSHPFTPAVLEMAERNPSMIGLSHNAEGRITKQDGKNVVEEITRVRSVDLVADPATASGLFESQKWSIDAMSSSEFAERLFEADGSYTPPPAADAGVSDDRELTSLQKAVFDVVEKATSVSQLVEGLQSILDARRSMAAGPEFATAAASESVDAYSFASQLTEDVRGVRSSSGRDPAAAFAAALFD